MPHFRTEQLLPHSIDRVFAFFADPANLPRLMPAWQRARIESANLVAPPPPPPELAVPQSLVETIQAGSGTELHLTLQPFPLLPLRLPWIAVIEDFRWLEGFCDVQQTGPFTHWRHCHTLSPQPYKAQLHGTLLTDVVEYTVPLGPLGTLADALFLRHQIAATFRFRHQRTFELLAKE